MNKPKVAPQDLTLLDEFEKNVETVIGVLENSLSIIDQWNKGLPNSARTGGRLIPQKTIDDLLLMLHSFYPFGDLSPEIRRFLIIHVPQFESEVKKGHSDINKKIDEIIGKCEQGPHPLNPIPNPAIPYGEMTELRRYIEKLVEDLRFCVRIAREKLATGTAGKIKLQEKGGQSKTNIPDYKALNLAKVPISKLIQQSESHTLEFKEIPECNTQQNRKNNDVLFPPLKTIAGFLNAEGGILLIGVDNSGKIVGIEPYLNTMEQGNNDTFEQQIRNCLRDRFEPYPIGKVKVSFEKFMEGTVCRIDVQAAKEPVNLDNKIYVRDGNTTQLLKGRRLTDWIQQRRLLTALPSGK